MKLGRIALLAAFVALGLASRGADQSAAHGGREVYSQQVGPYHVQAFLLELSGVGEAFVDYTVTLRAADTGRPVDDAKVTVTATTPDGVQGPATANWFANAHDVVFPLGAEGKWTMSVSIDSSLGLATFDHTVTPLPVVIYDAAESQKSGTPALLVLGSAGAISAAVAGFLILKRRKRTAESPFDE